MTSPLPIRILVVGASTVNWTSYMSGPRTDFTFPRAIEAELAGTERMTEVRNSAVLASPTKAFLQRWEEDVLQWSPDVIVCVAGHYETIHQLLPRWLERHANRLNTRPGPIRSRYRRPFLKGAWRTAVKVQSRLDRRLPAVLWRRRLNRVAADLTAYIALCRRVASPAVLVLEILPPAARQAAWFPGMTDRVALLNERLAEVVAAAATPDVEFIRTREVAALVCGGDQQAATPDGFHFTPELHRELGAHLARRIMSWADAQPHLSGAADVRR